MRIILFVIMASFIDCITFERERKIVKKSKVWVKAAHAVVSIINVGCLFLCPYAVPSLTIIQLMLEMFKNFITAYEFALTEFDLKRIKKSEFKKTVNEELERCGGLAMSISSLANKITAQFTGPINLVVESVKNGAANCTIN